MKHLFFSVIALVLAAAALACAGQGSRNEQAGSGLVDGEYEGTARAYRGDIHVRVCVHNGVMSEIEIIDSPDDRFVGGAAIEELQELALIYNTADLDAISGATESSDGFLAALSAALEQAAWHLNPAIAE
jgi:uncharacterized protein with FMN-binding domain